MPLKPLMDFRSDDDAATVEGACRHGADGFIVECSAAARRSLTRCLELAPQDIDAKELLKKVNQRGWSITGIMRRLFG